MSIQQYKKLSVLGTGSYGKCFLAKNIQTEETCVLKQIEISGMKQDDRDQAMKEAVILSALDHPHIINFTACFISEEESYMNIVMSYADGGDLAKKIQDAKGIPFAQNRILDWLTQICLALKHVHDRKIIHRDLKSHNIFLTKEGIIKLGDFGIARPLNSTLQKIKTVKGTPYYMSPEICENKQYTCKTDIWSLGVILYEMCTLKQPFDAGSLPGLALKISKGIYPPVPNTVNKEIRKLITDMLQVNPQKRPNVHKILKHSLIQPRIQLFLSPQIKQKEFSHTTLHSQYIFQKDYFTMGVIQKKVDFDMKNIHEFGKLQIEVDFGKLDAPSEIYTPNNQKNPSKALSIRKDLMENHDKRFKKQQLRRREISEPNLTPKNLYTFQEKPKKIKQNNSLVQLDKKKSDKIDKQNRKDKEISFKKRNPIRSEDILCQLEEIKEFRSDCYEMKSKLSSQNKKQPSQSVKASKKRLKQEPIKEAVRQTLREILTGLIGEKQLERDEECVAKSLGLGLDRDMGQHRGLLSLAFWLEQQE